MIDMLYVKIIRIIAFVIFVICIAFEEYIMYGLYIGISIIILSQMINEEMNNKNK